MKTKSAAQPKSILGKPVRALAIITLLCAWTAVSRAEFAGGDLMDSGSSNWTPVPEFAAGDGRVLFQNDRAEFIVGTPAVGDNIDARRWTLNTGSYAKDWSVEVGVHLGTILLPVPPETTGSNNSFVNLNLVIASAKNFNNAFSVAIDRYQTHSNYVSNFECGFNSGPLLEIQNPATDGSLKISFNSAQKTLTAFYNTGSGWNKMQTVSIKSGTNNWKMAASDVFYAVLASSSGYDSGGAAAAIASGDAYYTNFLATTGTIADGIYHQDFSGSIPLWDIAGDYSGEVASGLGLDFSLQRNPFGKLTGDGTITVATGSWDATGDTTLTGTVVNSGTATRVALTVLVVSGSGTITVPPTLDLHDMTFTGTIKLTGEIDRVNGLLVVTGGSAIAKIKDLVTGKLMSQSTKLTPGATLDLPGDVTGDWGITLDLTPNGTSYTGTATVLTSNGGTADLSASGSYSPKTGASKITLKGDAGSLSLGVSTSGTNLTIQSLKGKLFGQSLSYTAP